MLSEEMPDQKPQNSTDAAEIEQSFVETVSRAKRFLISSAIILFILVVIVGQELREYRRKQTSLVKQIVSTAQNERGAVKRLYAQHDCIREELDRVGKQAGLQLLEVPRRTSSVHDSKDIDALERDDKRLEEIIKDLKEKLDKPEQNLSTEQAVVSAPPAPSSAEYSNKSRKGSHHSKTSAKATQVLSVSPGRCEVDDDAPKQGLYPLFFQLAKYRDLYNDHIDLGRTLLNVSKESEELRAAKKSIPTPFGSFDIAPRLALLGLAFSLMLIYFSFSLTVRKIRHLADQYRHATAGEGSPSLHIPPPLWLPSGEYSDDSVPKHFSDVFLSVTLHVVWLFLTGWLVFECLSNWSATKVLAFDYKTFWGYLLIAAFVCVVLFAVSQFFPGRWKNTRAAKTLERVSFDRRRVVILSAMGALGVLTVGVVSFLRKQRNFRWPRLHLAEYTVTPNIDEWIQHKESKIIHYAPSCEKHLPKKQNQIILSPENLWVHAGQQARIFNDLANQTLASKTQLLTMPEEERNKKFLELDQQAITYLNKALAVSPLSCHLYDKLCSILGRLGRYEEIPPLFDKGLSHVKLQRDELAKLANNAAKKRKLKVLDQREKDFYSRIQGMKNRKKGSERRAAKKAQAAKNQSGSG